MLSRSLRFFGIVLCMARLVASQPGHMTFRTVNGQFGVKYNESVNSSVLVSYKYEYLHTEDSIVRVTTSLRNRTSSTDEFPLFIVPRQEASVDSWSLPFHMRSGATFSTVSRTLCSYGQVINDSLPLTIQANTYNNENVGLELQVDKFDNFTLTSSTDYTIYLEPSYTAHYQYSFNGSQTMATLIVNSSDSMCAFVSIQPTKCPVFALSRNVESSERYQTFNHQAAIKLDPKKGDTQYIVFVVDYNNFDCNKSDSTDHIDGKMKKIEFRIDQPDTEDIYKPVIVAVIGFGLAVCILSAAIIGLFCRFPLAFGIRRKICTLCKRSVWIWQSKSNHFKISNSDNRAEVWREFVRKNGGQADGICLWLCYRHFTSECFQNRSEVIRALESDIKTEKLRLDSKANPTLCNSEVSLIDHLQQDSTTEPGEGKNKDEMTSQPQPGQSGKENVSIEDMQQSEKNVADLSQPRSETLAKEYSLYCWYLGVIVIFYALPVIQIVFTYQRFMNDSGNQDTCYYNFLCARPLWIFHNFNNIISNIVYIILGIFFIIVIICRQNKCCKKQENNTSRINYGIAPQYGIYYAMGGALIVEGIMSGCYHLCPTYTNFQFDMAFMYIMGGLMILRLYQSRHPDISVEAHIAYLVLACIILISVLGVVEKSLLFWVVFCIALIATTLITGIFVLFRGCPCKKKLQSESVIDKCNEWWRVYSAKPVFKARLVLVICFVVVNVVVGIIAAVFRPAGQEAFFILVAILADLIVYLIYYCIMKAVAKEEFPIVSIIFLLIGISVAVYAVHLFSQELTDWQKTAALSRNGNKKCIMLDYFDSHDVWHFTSAIGVLCLYMAIFHLDDPLANTPTKDIPVF